MSWNPYHVRNTLRRTVLIVALALWAAVMIGALVFLPGCSTYYLAKTWDCPGGDQVIALQDMADSELDMDNGAMEIAAERGFKVVRRIRERWFPDIFMGRWSDGGTEAPLRYTIWYRLSNDPE